jgi:hypothetical protein
MHNHIRELLNLPPKNKSLDYKWIFKENMKVDETTNKYKVRCVFKWHKYYKPNLKYMNEPSMA